MPGDRPEDRVAVRTRVDQQVTVLVVDDHESFRSVLRELVDATEGFFLVGEAASGESALEAADRLVPRMVIMDKRMPGIGGVEAARLLAARHPRIVTLLVSVEAPDQEHIPAGSTVVLARKQELTKTLLREVWRAHGRNA
jgi:DNA-binding NarL/FixJ family response regulator